MAKVSCIIPAYNEGDRIAAVLRVATGHQLIDEIIVVDDGSSDHTARVARTFENARVRVIGHVKNRGKSAAIHTGLGAATGEYIFLLDADLVGLDAKHITELLTPVLEGRADKSISLRGNSPGIWRAIGLDYISGERVFPRHILDGHYDKILALPRFGLEVFLNKLALKNRCRLRVVRWSEVASPYKYKKHGVWRGILGDARMMLDIFRTVSPLESLYQIFRMSSMKVKGDAHAPMNVSLVIPAHNEEKYIGECLRHAIKNSHGRFFEIVVIDNASTDRTAEIAKTFPGVRVVREDTKGLTYARQRGYIEARGDILAFIDADTRMPAGWYDMLVAEFFLNKKLACLSGPYVYHDIPFLHRAAVKVFSYALMMPTYFLVGYMTIGGNFAIRKSVLQKMNGFDTSIAFYGEDTNIARRASAYGKVKFRAGFVMSTSGRRLVGQGFFKTTAIYVANFFSEVFAHKQTTQKYKDIR